MIIGGFCISAKLDLLQGVHQPGDNYRMALYADSADLSPATTAYSADDEASGAGYDTGGKDLSGYSSGTDGDSAWLDWSDALWLNSTISARGALIYNASKENKALVVIDFGEIVSSSNGTFQVIFPPAGASTAIVRIP